MLFSSLTFLLIYLPVVLILYFVTPTRIGKNLILFGASLLFYSWGEPKTIFLMLFEILITYIIGLKIDSSEDLKKAKRWLIAECIIVLGFLFVFKYYNFFVVQLMKLTYFEKHIVLPIGISFYSFQILSYIIDVYNGKVEAQKNFINLALYVCLFPQLIAGPIVRYQTVADELVNRRENIEDFSWGARRFIIGLGKKIIISNHMAIVADMIFKSPDLLSYSGALCWVGAISFMFQIYFDFSGYSDMAIGLGKMFGFHFLENFNYPYTSTSVTDFWRRWHISLSSWFKDYVYIPLGGSRVSKGRWIFNLAIVWALTGLWHGAAMTFVLWGAYYGILLIMEKLVYGKYLHKLKGLNWVLTMIIVLIGWVLFNAPRVSVALTMIYKMFTDFGLLSRSVLNNMNILYLWPYYVLAIFGSFPWYKKLVVIYKENTAVQIGYDFYLLIVFGLCILFLINNSYNPFIYFRF